MTFIIISNDLSSQVGAGSSTGTPDVAAGAEKAGDIYPRDIATGELGHDYRPEAGPC